jgi:multiple sugar transport system permease protein
MKRSSRLEPAYVPYLFILPCIILIVAILVYPVTTGILKSFYNENLLIPIKPEFVGLDNYIDLFNDNMFLSSLGRSIIWTLIILFFEMIIAMFFAVILNSQIFVKKLFRSLILIPWIIPNAICGIIWKWFLNDTYGMLNYLLKSVGLISNNLPWLSDPTLAEVSLIIVITWKNIPFITITLLAGLQAISPEYYESAIVDGANPFACFRYITLPMIKNISIIVAILTSIWNFNQFDIIQVMTRGGPGEATTTLPIYLYRLFMQSFQTSYACAAAVIMMVIMIIPIIIYVNKLLKG